MPNFSSFKKGTCSQSLFGFPIFQVGVHKVQIFQVKYLILTFLKKWTSGQPLFGFPIFKCVKQIFAQGPVICPLQVLDRSLWWWWWWWWWWWCWWWWWWCYCVSFAHYFMHILICRTEIHMKALKALDKAPKKKMKTWTVLTIDWVEFNWKSKHQILWRCILCHPTLRDRLSIFTH